MASGLWGLWGESVISGLDWTDLLYKLHTKHATITSIQVGPYILLCALLLPSGQLPLYVLLGVMKAEVNDKL